MPWRSRGAALVLVVSLASACSGSARTPATAPSTVTTPAVVELPPGGPVPPGFVTVDSTWIDTTTGWALGTAPCATPPCTSMVRTADGGRTWVGVPAPKAFLFGRQDPNVSCVRDPCVSHVRFADARTGYAYGPSLFVTHDGGRTWTRGVSPQVAALEVGRGRAVRVVTDSLGCPPGCQYRVEKVDVAGAPGWVPLPAPPLGGGRVELLVDGARIYAAAYGNPAGGASDAHAQLVRSLDDGNTWQSSGDPCGSGPAGEVDARSLAVAPGDLVAVLCQSRSGTVAPSVSISVNAGATFGPPRSLPLPAGNGGAQLVSAGSSRVLAVAYVTGRRLGVLVSHDGGGT